MPRTPKNGPLWWPSPGTRAGVMHDGCDYLAGVGGDGDEMWFCNQCGAAGLTSEVTANG